VFNKYFFLKKKRGTEYKKYYDYSKFHIKVEKLKTDIHNYLMIETYTCKKSSCLKGSAPCDGYHTCNQLYLEKGRKGYLKNNYPLKEASMLK
jgi:hypothetical protein